MAIRRTFKQKQQAQLKREEEIEYTLPGAETETEPAKKKTEGMLVSQAEPSMALKLFGYDPKLVYNDLRRTLFATGVVVSILLVVFFLMR